jgi:hypothetical protein
MAVARRKSFLQMVLRGQHARDRSVVGEVFSEFTPPVLQFCVQNESPLPRPYGRYLSQNRFAF